MDLHDRGKSLAPDGGELHDAELPRGIAGSLKILLLMESRISRQCVAYVLKLALKDSVIRCAADVSTSGMERPDVILIEVRALPLGAAAIEEAFTRLLGDLKGCPVVALSDLHDVELARAALRAGFRGFLSPSADIDTAIAAIKLVVAGGVYVPSDLVSLWMNDTSTPIPEHRDPLPKSVPLVLEGPVPSIPSCDSSFTEREFEVIDRLKMGKPNKIIAYELDITESTVKVHIRNIMRKLSATNRTQVAFLTREMLKQAPNPKPNLLCNGIVVGPLSANGSKPISYGG